MEAPQFPHATPGMGPAKDILALVIASDQYIPLKANNYE